MAAIIDSPGTFIMMPTKVGTRLSAYAAAKTWASLACPDDGEAPSQATLPELKPAGV
jgi:hypothetical protein